MRRLAIAVLAAFLVGYLAGQADASDSALSSPAGIPPLTTTGVTSGPGLLSGAPDGSGIARLGRAPSPQNASAAQRSRRLRVQFPLSAPSGAPPDPGTTAPPIDAWTRQGIIAWAAPSHGPRYLAIPAGPGHDVVVCAVRCLRLISTDAGPDRAMQRAGRIGDLAVELWEHVCDVPRSAGLCEATIRPWRLPRGMAE